MSEKPISPLRRRMLEDMAVRRLGEKTQSNYIRHIETFTAFLGRSPDTATAEDVRRFQIHLTETGVGPSSRWATSSSAITACLACCSPTAATRSRQATVQRSFATNRDGSSRPCG